MPTLPKLNELDRRLPNIAEKTRSAAFSVVSPA